MKKGEKEFDISEVIGGTLNVFGIKVDLAKLLSSPEEVGGQLEGLRERLKQLGGKEVLSDEEWKRGATSVSGYVRTRGILEDREYHIGTSAKPRPRARPAKAPEQPLEVAEPPLDIFEEPEQVTIVADVPGIGLEDLKIVTEGKLLSISTRSTARRAYRKAIELSSEVEPESLQSTCRNGVLELRLWKKAAGGQHPS